ncbi:lymphatic vessel endothelial hyaluronic receptor 1b [Clinocottus analis]|uniref:lymphatic vessel endothelial hyaluronic receptor 1b n=1 Tax=Clinocottus analis TaxID=304258 RepID=UPI0035C0AC7F
MAGFAPRCLLFSLAVVLLASDSELIEAPAGLSVAGVFLLMDGGSYSFNAAAAGAACLSLSVRIASRAQMERAVQRGLQTCKFGWIAERIAVVPRLTADEKCGKGKTGLVTWFAKKDQKFGVFCFNASDFQETPNRSTAGPHGSSSTQTSPTRTSPTRTTLTRTSPPRTSPPLRSASESPPSQKQGATEAPEQTSSTSSSTPLIQTTRSTSVSHTSLTLKPSSTRLPPSLPPLVPSTPGVVFSTSARASSFSRSSESVTSLPAGGSMKPPLGNVLTALVVLGVIVLLLTAASSVWCYKLNIFSFGSRVLQKDDVETEMRKHADGEVQSPHEGGRGGGGGGEEEEEDRKYSSDVTLCVTPDFKTNPSE